MAYRIGLQLDGNSFSLAPGETAQIALTLTNTGSVVDEFLLSVEGLDPAWYTLSVGQIPLFPDDTGEAVLALHPPAVRAIAGTYSFRVVATSDDDPTVRSEAEVVLNLAATGGAALEIEPRRVLGRKGLYAVTIANSSNRVMPLVLSVTDPDEALQYMLGTVDVSRRTEATQAMPATPEPVAFGDTTAQGAGRVEYELDVPAGGTATVPVMVAPRKRIWTGRDRALAFSVATHPPGVEWEAQEARRVDAELVYRPLLAAWSALPIVLRRALAIGIPLLVLAGILFLLFRPGPQPAVAAEPSATETAQAIAAATEAAAGSTGSGGDGSGDSGGSGSGGSDSGGPIGPPTGNPAISRFYMVIPSPSPGVEADEANKQPNLEWDVTSALGVRVDQAARPANFPGYETSTLLDYSLVATGTARAATETLSVLLIRPASIESFAGTPMTITLGESSTLGWSVKGAKAGTVDGAGVDLGPGGQGQLVVTPPETRYYTLCATNSAGTTCRATRIWVVTGGGGAPATETATSTATSTAVVTSTVTMTGTPPATPTRTQTARFSPTSTRVPPTFTATRPATFTSTRPPATFTTIPTLPPTFTNTAIPTNTETQVPTRPPTNTETPEPTDTPQPTDTPIPTDTPVTCPPLTSPALVASARQDNTVLVTWRSLGGCAPYFGTIVGRYAGEPPFGSYDIDTQAGDFIDEPPSRCTAADVVYSLTLRDAIGQTVSATARTRLFWRCTSTPFARLPMATPELHGSGSAGDECSVVAAPR